MTIQIHLFGGLGLGLVWFGFPSDSIDTDCHHISGLEEHYHVNPNDEIFKSSLGQGLLR